MNFFSAPEASGSDLGALREGKKRISCCAPCFFRLREAPGSDFGAILARFWNVFGAFLKRFGGKLEAALAAVLAAVLLGLLWFLMSPRVAAARNFPKASPGSSRKAARIPQENSGKRSQL